MARSSESVSACRRSPANNTVANRTNTCTRSFISSPVIRPRLSRDAQIVVRGREAGQGIDGSASKRVGLLNCRSSRSNPLQRPAGGLVIAGKRQSSTIFARGATFVALLFEQLAENVMSLENGCLLDRTLGKIAAQQLDGEGKSSAGSQHRTRRLHQYLAM